MANPIWHVFQPWVSDIFAHGVVFGAIGIRLFDYIVARVSPKWSIKK